MASRGSGSFGTLHKLKSVGAFLMQPVKIIQVQICKEPIGIVAIFYSSLFFSLGMEEIHNFLDLHSGKK